MRIALALAAGLFCMLPVSALAQESEFSAVDPTGDPEIEADYLCTPWPACYFNPPSGPPIGGGGGIFTTGRAPGFELEGSWEALELNEEGQPFILRPDRSQWQAPGEFIQRHELPN